MRAIGRIKVRRKHLIRLMFAPLVFWFLMVELMPTRWLARRLEDSLQRITGLDTSVDRLRLTLSGGVILHDVHLGAAEDVSDGNLSQIDVSKVHLDVDWMSVLCGRLAMTDLQIIGIDGQLIRSPNGSWLPQRWLEPLDDNDEIWTAGRERAWLVNVEIRGGRLVIEDPQHHSKVLLTGLTGIAEAGEGCFNMKELRAKLDGGELVAAISADKSQEIPIFDSNLVIRNVPLGVHFDVLGFVCPLLAGDSAMPKGRLDLELYLQGRLEENWCDTLKGRGVLKLDPISVAGLPVVEKLGLDSLAAEINGKQTRIEDVTIRIANPFTIQSRKIISPAMLVEIGPVPLKFEGWTDFDGQLDYAIRTDAIREQLPVGMRGVLDDLNPKDEALAIRGKLDKMTILVNEQPIATDRYRIRKTDLRSEVEQISKRLSNQLMR